MAVENWGVLENSFDPCKRNVRECVLYNCDTKVAIKCQYNPSNLPRERGVNYATITSPGMAYPTIQFVNGEEEDIDIDLFLYDMQNPARLNNMESFIESLLPPKHNSAKFERPPMFKFYYGKTVENYVLLKKTINEELLREDGEPYSRSYTLSARRV